MKFSKLLALALVFMMVFSTTVFAHHGNGHGGKHRNSSRTATEETALRQGRHLKDGSCHINCYTVSCPDYNLCQNPDCPNPDECPKDGSCQYIID